MNVGLINSWGDYRSKRGKRVYLPEAGRKFKHIVADQKENGDVLALQLYDWLVCKFF
jgi:hypothetical protein